MRREDRHHLPPAIRAGLLVGFLLCGTLLYLTCSSNDPSFHADEALFAYWARIIASGQDVFLVETPVDKPPLLLYAVALSFRLFGPTLLAARVPNLLAGVTSILLLYRLGARLYDPATALVAALLVTLSPFSILFAPTAFTDPLMNAFVLAALLLAAEGRPSLSGATLGMATMAKQSGIFFVPLVLMLALKAPADDETKRSSPTRTIARLTVGLSIVLAVLFVWNGCRQVERGFLLEGWAHYGGLKLEDPLTLPGKLGQWAQLLGYFTASPALNGILLGGIPLLLAYDLLGPSLPGNRLPLNLPAGGTGTAREEKNARHKEYDLLLLGFIFLYLEMHWVVSFNAWGRYLLILVPLLSLVLARVLHLALRVLSRLGISHRAGTVLSLVLVAVLLARPAWTAAQAGYPIGSDHGAYGDVDQVAAYVRETVPPEAVIYHHWLGHHFLFYLFGAPHTPRWYKTPEGLAADVCQDREPCHVTDGLHRYLVTPSWEDAGPLEAALAERGLSLELQHQIHDRDGAVTFRVYLIAD